MSSKYRVCPICGGEGGYVNPAIDSHGLTADDFEEAGPDFADDYMRGVYDKQCECCHGQRVVTAKQLAEYDERLVDFRTQMAESGEFYGDSRL